MTACALVAVEWGSAQRRIFGIDADGAICWRHADDRGVSKLDATSLEVEVDALVARGGGAPVLMAGMIGSDRGWRHAPYVACPARVETLAAALIEPREGVWIVPGLSYDTPVRADVMRGEEVQMLGAIALGIATDGMMCVPGKHAKWASVKAGQITAFRTMITGEIFAHLRNAGVLALMIGASDVTAAAPFEEGVAYALDGHDVLSQLFQARSRVLLGRAPADGVAGYVLGLLIGSEVQHNLVKQSHPVAVVGDRAVCASYVAALQVAGQAAVMHDGEQAFIAGIRAIWQASFVDN